MEAQYARWQQQRAARALKYRRALDPTVEDVRALCLWLRRQARHERVLCHYNGHGVPRPTSNGEIWVFDKGHTEYIPLSITDLRLWLGKPSMVILDCSSAGVLIPFLTAPISDLTPPSSPLQPPPVDADRVDQEQYMETMSSQWVRETIVLCPTSEGEWLPMHPDYPADIFTSCLTTPIKIALRWFVRRNQQSMGSLHPDAVDAIPGKENDRKTPLGELNWIFTAVTDSIAWNVLPKPLFQRLFRQDLLVASMFRNFLLTDRILRSLNCTPQSHPPLPPGVNTHPLWDAFDLAMETCLFGLMKDGILGNHIPLKTSGETNCGGLENQAEVAPADTHVSGPASSISSPFFSEQLTAFEVWLEFALIRKSYLMKHGTTMDSPEQLPVVLQVLLSQVHRVRALSLLREFLELGPWAVNTSLSLGIFPYVMKLLQSPEYKSLLVSIWASILAFDSSCQADLVKDNALPHFIQHLTWGLSNTSTEGATMEAAKERTLAAFILAVATHGFPQGQTECSRLNLSGAICTLLSSYEAGENAEMEPDREVAESHLPGHFRMWLCLCLANVAKQNLIAQKEAFAANVHVRLFSRMGDSNADVRAAACCALGCLLEAPVRNDSPPSDNIPGPNIASVPLVPQRMAPNMGVPPGVSSSSALPVSLQPSFSNAPGMNNLHWHSPHQPQPPHPNQMNMMMQQQMPGTLPGLQPIPLQTGLMPGAQMHLRPHSQPYVMHGAPFQPNLGGGPPPSFMVGNVGRPMGLEQPGMLMHPSHQHVQETTGNPRRKSVYDDKIRLGMDLDVLEVLCKACQDASSVVRYEATVSIALCVSKYLSAFLHAADIQSTPHHEAGANSDSNARDEGETAKADSRSTSRELEALDKGSLDRFLFCWKTLRKLQHFDPHPHVGMVSNSIVMFVHEILLERRAERDGCDDKDGPAMKGSRPLCGIEEDDDPPVKSSPPPSDGPPHRSDQMNQAANIRRVASEISQGNAIMKHSTQMDSPGQPRKDRPESNSKMDYILPKSKFYEWKKRIFTETCDSQKERDNGELDPLSPLGATRAYQERRNFLVHETKQKVASHFESLSPKPPKPSKQSIELIMAPPAENAEDDAANTLLKKELELKESTLLSNTGVKMTTILRFHPYEDVLAACGAEDGVTLWDISTGTRSITFNNGNSKGSRMTSATWINAASTSLFVVGCDDGGSLRIWGGLLESNGETSKQPPRLVSAFFAAPDIVAGERGRSGMVVEWQQYSGTLIAGGDSRLLRCWDLDAEKCNNVLETDTTACLTTLTSAWDYENLGTDEPKGSPGYGPNLLVGGFSDGSLRLFDIRTNKSVSETSIAKSWTKRRRPTKFNEHNSWIVNTTFTGYGSRYEVVSGSVAGDIKAWDLRMSSSQRTFEVQRSTMTALAIHKTIPVVATGSHAQFIKILTLGDGETLKVIRYHEEMANHRIGPVSCLEFHPSKPILAAGATDSFVSIYSPNGEAWAR